MINSKLISADTFEVAKEMFSVFSQGSDLYNISNGVTEYKEIKKYLGELFDLLISHVGENERRLIKTIQSVVVSLQASTECVLDKQHIKDVEKVKQKTLLDDNLAHAVADEVCKHSLFTSQELELCNRFGCKKRFNIIDRIKSMFKTGFILSDVK